MARLDVQCATCELVIRDINVPADKILGGGKVRLQCPDCKSRTFYTVWDAGEAPGVAMIGNDNERIYDSSKTVGEYLDRAGVELGGKKYNEASKARVQAMREKAKKNAKRSKGS